MRPICRMRSRRTTESCCVLQLAGELGQSIPWACLDWSNVKAAYRFLSNPRVDESAILAGHFASTREVRTLSAYLTKRARLGGYLAKSKDPPPGNMVMWRGLSRLKDIGIGFIVGVQLVGN